MKEIIGGRYEFDRATDIIGRGGMGTVYRGRDIQTGDVVAIKQLRPDLTDADIITRFIREGEILRQFQHPHIIRVLDTISDVELGHYLVMEYITGGSLWDELQAYNPFPISRVVEVAHHLASALMVVHEQGIVHRDIKPSNVLIADDKSPRLCDFGVIHLTDKTRLTETGGLIGTLDYLAPETLNGEPITIQSDIWALGVMVYEMLAGSRPFIGDSVGTLITNILTESPINLADLRPDIPPNLIRLVEWMLVKNQSNRVANMSIIHQTLMDIIAGTDNIPAIIDIKPFLGGRKILKRIRALPKLFTNATFYDRDHEQADITNAILEGKSFIGIYGRGGIGKTGLVSKVLGDFENRGVVDGVAYLRADSTPPLNNSLLLDTLGEFLTDDHAFHTIKQNASISTREKTQTLLDGLSGGRYLIYIDNLETLQDDATYALTDADMNQFFEDVLDRNGSPLTVIITSRYPIPFPHILKAHETIIRLDEGLPQTYAVQFLRQMDSQKVLPQTDTQLNLWVEKVGGFPRGLEALVGYLNGGDTRHIEDLLDDPHLFEGEVLSNIVHHAHNSLPTDFRQVLAGVAVIGQSTTRAEVEYLLTPYLESAQLRRILERLVESRFLAYHRQNRTYSLHPIDQAYALSSTPLGKSGDDDKTFTRYVLHGRMADYYVNQRKPESEWKSLDDVQPQLREMEHRYVMGDYDGVATIFLTMSSDYMLVWGYIELVLQWHTRLEGLVQNPILVMQCMGNLGLNYRLMDNAEKAIFYYKKALVLAREQGIKKNEGSLLGNLGAVYRDLLGQLGTVIEYYQQALAIAREINDKTREGIWLGNLGLVYSSLGQVNTAIAYYQQALAIAREINDNRNESRYLGYLGNAYAYLGQLDTTIAYYQQALTIAREVNDKFNEGVWLGNLGSILTWLGRYAEAITHIEEAIAIATNVQSPALLQYLYGSLATAHWFAGDMPNARSTIRQARTYDIATYNHAVANLYGCIAFCMGEKQEAQTAFHEALAFANALIEESPGQYEILYSRALMYVGLWVITGDDTHHADAIKAYEEAKAVNAATGTLLEYRQLLEALLRCADKDGTAIIAILQ